MAEAYYVIVRFLLFKGIKAIEAMKKFTDTYWYVQKQNKCHYVLKCLKVEIGSERCLPKLIFLKNKIVVFLRQCGLKSSSNNFRNYHEDLLSMVYSSGSPSSPRKNEHAWNLGTT
ncbi:hypothetical protein NPIL_312671 [Nephila pilipes]|uniref:Uncharacterized protein n=1 Tax=Nephila pilipes TaxID=299642 RepID=A0A8X6QUK5_NEPPI|nr:hypothetical protein NPIL_312671 [Nephila pilipes]